MSLNIGLEVKFDSSDFDKKFDDLNRRRLPKALDNASFQVAQLILADAITEEPTVPKKSGHLRRDTQTINPLVIETEAVWREIGFNAPYAARLHEAPSNWNWSEPGSGPKYLETKLSRNKDKYRNELGARFEKELMSG